MYIRRMAKARVVKSSRIPIRVTPTQNRTLQAAADRAGIGLSTWVLMVALEAARIEDAMFCASHRLSFSARTGCPKCRGGK